VVVQLEVPAVQLVDVNTAAVDELVALPGIGPKKAQAIVDDRAKRGRFPNVEALDRVKGIGPVTVERLRPYVSVREKATP
jgi:competence protein ComEA